MPTLQKFCDNEMRSWTFSPFSSLVSVPWSWMLVLWLLLLLLQLLLRVFLQTKVTGIRLRDLHIITVGNSPQCEGFPNYLFWVIRYQKSWSRDQSQHRSQRYPKYFKELCAYCFLTKKKKKKKSGSVLAYSRTVPLQYSCLENPRDGGA